MPECGTDKVGLRPAEPTAGVLASSARLAFTYTCTCMSDETKVRTFVYSKVLPTFKGSFSNLRTFEIVLINASLKVPFKS